MPENLIDDHLRERIQKIRLLVFDCDGVLTDGRITFLPDGGQSKSFDVRDGLGISLAIRAGLRTAIISGRESSAVEHRARDLGIHHLRQKSTDKIESLDSILKQESLTMADVGYVGDDLVDIPVMRHVGVAIAVADAVAEAKQAAHYITSLPGGRGAVREAIELILKTQGKWESVTKHYTT